MAAVEYGYSWGRHAGTISMDLKVIRQVSGISLFQEESRWIRRKSNKGIVRGKLLELSGS
jgi:hypothetical protein